MGRTRMAVRIHFLNQQSTLVEQGTKINWAVQRMNYIDGAKSARNAPMLMIHNEAGELIAEYRADEIVGYTLE